MNKQLQQEAVDTLRLVQRMHTEALPKFNWGASALDANAIDLLNQSGLRVTSVLAKIDAKDRAKEQCTDCRRTP